MAAPFVRGTEKLVARLFSYIFFIRFRVEQIVERGCVAYLDLHQPCSVGVLVDLFRRVVEIGVDLGDGAGDGRVEIADGLNTLDGAEGVMRGESCAHFGQIDKDDIAERRLRVVGNANSADVAVYFNPLVFFGVFIGRRIAHARYSRWVRAVYGVKAAFLSLQEFQAS